MRASVLLALAAVACSREAAAPSASVDAAALPTDAAAPPDGGTTSDAQPRADAGGCSTTPLTTSLLPFVDAIVRAMAARGGAGSGAVVVPSPADRDAFASAAVAALSGDAAAACRLPPSYRVVSFADGSDTLLAVAEVDGNGQPAPSLFWGTFVARAGGGFARVVVEAPHPLFDLHTEHEAADVFLRVRASALLVAGAHRCADAGLSGCSGTTTACTNGGPAAPFRVSDAAHATALPFDAVHDAVSRASSAPFLQLHGNGETCPDALVSDGSGAWSDAGPTAALARELEARGVSVGRCGQGFPTAGCDLCGTDNVQARFTAGSPDACTMMGTSYGRLVHVEQQPALRALPDGGPPGYAALLEAAAAAFP